MLPVKLGISGDVLCSFLVFVAFGLFFPTQRVPFNLSSRAGLVVTNSFSFCLSGEVLFLSLFFYCLFIFEREREREREREGERERKHAQVGERQRERGRHRIGSRLQALSCQHRADMGLELMNCEIMT